VDLRFAYDIDADIAMRVSAFLEGVPSVVTQFMKDETRERPPHRR